jgi:hypothetical protein
MRWGFTKWAGLEQTFSGSQPPKYNHSYLNTYVEFLEIVPGSKGMCILKPLKHTGI